MPFWSYLAAWQVACCQADTESASTLNDKWFSCRASEVEPIAAVD